MRMTKDRQTYVGAIAVPHPSAVSAVIMAGEVHGWLGSLLGAWTLSLTIRAVGRMLAGKGPRFDVAAHGGAGGAL